MQQHSTAGRLCSFTASQKFLEFYENRKFITAFTTVRKFPLSSTQSVQSAHSHPICWRSTLTLSSHLHLCLPSGLFPSDFPTKTLYEPLLSPIRAALPAYIILLDLITRWRSGQGTTLQTGRLRVRFPLVSLEFFSDIIFPVALWPCGRLSL